MSREERAKFEDRLLVQMPNLTSDTEDGSFLYGCLREDTASLDACIPSCLSGYKFANTPSCSRRVYIREEGVLVLKNPVKTDKAYAYLSQEDKVSTSETKFLHNKHGIRELYIYRKRDDSRDYEHVETLNLQSRKKKEEKSSTSNALAIVLALLILFIILVIIIYLVWSTCFGKREEEYERRMII